MKAWSFGNLFSSFAVPAGLQKRLVSFLLQRAIGHFLEDSLDLEKLDIELSNGIVHLTDLRLNSKVLNELVTGTPLAVTKGRIGSITATIPWRNLWNGQCVLEIDGIDITLAPVQAQSGHLQNLEEQLLSASVDLASDFIHQSSSAKDEMALQESILQTLQAQAQAAQAPTGIPGDFNYRPANRPSSPLSSSGVPTSPTDDFSDTSEGEGIQFVAKLIEKLMARIQIICKETTIRLQHSSSLQLVQPQSTSSKAETLDYELEIRLPYIAYRDESPGRDLSATGREPSSMAASSVYGTESTSGSTMLEDSVIPSVIWQDSPESIKTVVFKGFSIWVKQRGAQEEFLAQVDPTQQPSSPQEVTKVPVKDSADDETGSDSDSDVFADAQENFSQSMMASRIINRPTPTPSPTPAIPAPLPTASAPARSTRPTDQSRLYQAEILSTLQHKNRVKVNIRKNATMLPGPESIQAPSTVKSLLDIDFSIKSIFVALSPNQIAFFLEILSLMEHAPPQPASESPKQPPVPAYQTDIDSETRDDLGRIRDTTSRGSFLRSDNSIERPSLHTHRPMSPKQRSQQVDHLRVPQNKSPGGPIQEPDKHVDARNSRTTIPTPAAFLDSSRFLSGSTYSEHRTGSSTPSATSSSNSPALTMKVNAKIGTFRMFVLYQDPRSTDDIPTEDNFFKSPSPGALKSGHLKLGLDTMVLKYQQWALAGGGGGGGQKSAKQSKGQLDFKINNVAISEWIDAAPKPYDTRSWDTKKDQYRLPARKSYIPILEFDAAQDSLYQTLSNSKFANLRLPNRYMTERSRAARAKQAARQADTGSAPVPSAESQGATNDSTNAITKEVVRMRVMLYGKKDSSSQSALSPEGSQTTASAAHVRDVTIEVKPIHVHVDFFMFQRLEKVLLALMGSGNKTESSSSHIESTASQPPRSPRGIEQQIMDDLDGPRKILKPSIRLRLRLNSIQLWVSVPDMALALAEQPDNGPEYRSIYDVIALNVSKMVVTNSSDSSSKGSSPVQPTATSGFTGRDEDHGSKLKVEFTGIAVFVIPAHETVARAILMVGPLLNHSGSLSGFSSSMPYLEIVSRSTSSIPHHYERTPPTTFPRVPALQAFAILEGEENVHNAADEEQELMHFRQRTIETSLLLIDAHLSLVAVHLEKHILDNLQLRINDMSTWATLFSEKLASQLPAAPEPPKVEISSPQDRPLSFRSDESKEGRLSLDGGFRDDQSEHGTDQSTAYGEELRHLAEGHTPMPRIRTSRDFQLPSRLVKPTMVSVVLFAQTVDVILDYPTKPTVLDPVPIIKTYQINAGEARIFAGAKYQGGPDTYVTIDAEELEFWETTTQKVTLLKRTIPKNVKAKAQKPMFHMTSLLSFDPVVKFKENDTNLTFTGISWKFSIEQTAVDDVQDFFAEPAGIVYLNPPHQCTRVSVTLGECGMDYKPLHIPSRFVLSFEKMKVFSTLIPESPTLKSKVQIYNMSLFLIDHVQSIVSPQFPALREPGSGIDSKRFWSSLGFAQIGQCPFFELRSVKSKNGQLPLYDLSITNQMFYLETCSDSFETLTQFAAYMGDNGDMPIEKKMILERIAEADRANNRAMSNVVYQDILVASLDEDAFRKPKQDKDVGDAGTLEFVEGFYSVEREEAENDFFKVQMQDTPDVDGFHEVYADLLHGNKRSGNNSGAGGDSQQRAKGSTKTKGSKSKSKGQTLAPTRTESAPVSQMQSLTIPSLTRSRSSLEGGRRDEPGRKAGHAKKENPIEDIIRVLDPEAQFLVVENHFSIPVLTEEERAKDEGSLAKMRVRVRDFNFSWRLYDGLDWEISRLDEAERKKQARQFAKRLHDPNDAIHTTMDAPHSNLDASILEYLSGMQPGAADRQGHERRDFSPCSSEADSTSDYQNDVMSQASGAGGRPSSTSSNSGSRRSTHYQGRYSHSTVQGEASKRKRKLERSKTAMVEFNADKVRLDFEDYVSGVETASHLSVRVKEFEIIDNVKSSHWHKFLSRQRHDSSSTNPRSAQSNMIRIDLDGVRPVVSASTVEFRLLVRMSPLRLYIDQDALMFLIKFFVQGTGGGGPSGTGDTQPEGMAAVPDAVEKKKPNEMYFQSVRLGEIAVKMDYKPKHVDYTGLSGGNFVELMNFFHLDAAEMTLQEVRLHGINGFAKMGQDLVAAWLPHIRSTQVPNMVSGLTPIRSLVNLGSGIADLVLLPIEQYKRDGHIIRGLQKGGQAFTRATTLEALKIGAKLAVGTQVLLEHADEIFGSGAAATSGHGGKSTAGSRGVGFESDDGSDLHNNNSGKRVVATMVTDSEAYMQESIDDEDQLLQHLLYQQEQQQHLDQHHYLQSNGQGTSSSSPTGGSSTKGNHAVSRVSKYANQPADINEGMELAYKSLSKNIGTAAHTIFAVPMEVYEQTGAQGSVRAVIRAVPVAVLKPMIGATEAFSKVLIGIRNSIDPAQRLQNEDKYKRQ
ncbi:autophagy- protein 2 [Mortierella sp. NVP41]|nr:autophagy- protein 2 [Mortierella sp. NVP41]